MSEDTESLILRDRSEAQAQPFLFGEDEIPKIDKSKPKFHCNGERLHRDHPERYNLVVRALADPSLSVKWICEVLHVSPECLRSVRAREKIPIAQEKEILLSNLAHGARLATERAIETMPNASTKDAVLAVGVLTDKMQLLSGGVTERVEHIERLDIFSDFPAFIESLEMEVKNEVLESGCENTVTTGEKKILPIESKNGEETPPSPLALEEKS
jgi:hypothetical protein